MREEALPFNSALAIPRSPGVQVIANQQLMTGVIAAGVRSTSYFGADWFELTLTLDSDGPFWAREPVIDVDVRLRLDASSAYASVIQGRVDSVCLDPIARIVQVEGRDYSAALIDSVVCESFSNRTASEIATVFAERHGLQPIVLPTEAIVGRYYQDGYDTVLLDSFCGRASEWDLLAYLAQHERYDLFVSGSTLNFLPEAGAATPYCILTPNDLMELRLERMMPFAGNIEVVVKTWNSHERTADVQVASRSTYLDAMPGNETRRYFLVRPNLTSNAARELAQRKLAELCTHGSSIELLMPGELGLMPRGVLLLNGTGTDFDRAYRIDMVDRRFSPASGFVQRVRASSMPGAMTIG